MPKHVDRDISPAKLIGQVQDNSGKLVIHDPPESIRAAYRRAISAAIRTRAVPAGYVLRHTGRDHGDLVVSLVSADELPVDATRPPAVPIPERLSGRHEAVQALAARMDSIAVTHKSRPRALRIIEAIADEAVRREFVFATRPDGQPGFRILIGEDSYDFTMREEQDRALVIPADEVAAARYSWQRLSAKPAMVPTGRLVIEMADGYRTQRWADRKRWSLSDRLPRMFELIADRAAAAAKKRDEERERARLRHETWERAVPLAREQYIAAVNRERLDEQVTAWRQADDYRQFAAALQSHARDEHDDETRTRLLSWAQWAITQARQLDPLHSPDVLRLVEPADVAVDELDRFMPEGMTVRRPPEPPGRERSWLR